MKVGRWSQVYEYMNHNVCQRSSAFNEPVRLNITDFSVETAWPIEVIFHVEPAQDR